MLATVEKVGDELDERPPPCRSRRADRGPRAPALAGRRPLHVPRLPHVRPRARRRGRRPPARGARQRPRHPAQRARTGSGTAAGAAPTGSRSCRLPIRAKARERTLLVLTKANARSTVHRPTYLDYVGVKRFDARGQRDRRAPLPRPLHVVGVQREPDRRAGAAAQGRARSWPASGFAPASHDFKDLVAILESYPRDDLFQIDVDAPVRHRDRHPADCRSAGACSVFVHREQYGRFVSCLVFVPRDRYTTPVRRAHRRAAHGGVRRVELRVEHAPLGVGARPPALRACASTRRDPRRPVDVAELEARVAASAARLGRRSARHAGERPRRGRRPRPAPRRGTARFPARTRRTSRRPRRSPTSTELAALDDGERAAARGPARGRASTTSTSSSTASARSRRSPTCCPRLTNMGVIVDDEHPYTITPGGSRAALDQAVPPARAGRRSTPRRVRPLRGRRSSRSSTARPKTTAFNRLVLRAGLVVARGRAAARVQPLPPPGRHAVQPDLHRRHARRAPDIARRLSSCSRRASTRGTATRGATPTDARRARSPPSSTRSTSLDEDRILRALLAPRARDAAHELVPDRRRRPAPPVRRAQARSRARTRPPAPAADVRALRVLAARRRRAPACGTGRARRHPLVGPPRRLPHRGARADEGAEGQERGDRAVGREGRLRREAAARRSGARCAPRSRRATACSSRACSTSPTTS